MRCRTSRSSRWSNGKLANGDRVVYLRTPLARDKFYLSAYSNAGFMAKTLNPWQAQIASQIVAQSGTQGWRAENLRDWKQAQAVSFNVSQSADELQITGLSTLTQVQSLFQLYHAMNTQAGIDASVMKDSLASLMRQRANRSQSAGDLRQREVTRLRFGQPAYQEPDQAQLCGVTAQMLLTQWQQTVSAPVTYYLMANEPADTFLPLVERYLASLPRATRPAITPHRALAGTRESTVALNIEPHSEVRAWSYTEQPWTPQAAVQVSVARNLANKYLKNSLRDEALGIYRMRLDSELADKAQRIETEISFTASPERGHELWQRAEQVLKQRTAPLMLHCKETPPYECIMGTVPPLLGWMAQLARLVAAGRCCIHGLRHRLSQRADQRMESGVLRHAMHLRQQ
ncbi:hypothetical protein [Candidatus Symbiopectobacterium sp. PLON1]|uniref:hypothetical protein n=1 Tax=Candidatus Symbiopectobacterium sp. PLON1 TaxID=2794575 RepID=UPI0025BCFB52|nr:hypothetical protein [Candidatus Symbiopectobacterium sp. PLON1]